MIVKYSLVFAPQILILHSRRCCEYMNSCVHVHIFVSHTWYIKFLVILSGIGCNV